MNRLPRVRRLALIVFAVALLAGCGGEKTVTPTAETVVGQPPAAPQPAAQGDPAKGTTGPDLDNLPDYAQKAGKPLEEFTHESIESPDAYVEEGFPSGVMPAWSGDEQDLADLVAFLTKPA